MSANKVTQQNSLFLTGSEVGSKTNTNIKRGRGEKVKYILFVECKPENLDKWIKKTIQQSEERQKFPDKYPKLVMGNQFMGNITKAFVLYEVENEEQIINHELFWTGILKMKWIPILDPTKVYAILGPAMISPDDWKKAREEWEKAAKKMKQ